MGWAGGSGGAVDARDAMFVMQRHGTWCNSFLVMSLSWAWAAAAWHICWPTTTTATKQWTSKTCRAKYATARRTAKAAAAAASAAATKQQQPSSSNKNCNNGQQSALGRVVIPSSYVSVDLLVLFWGRPACLGYLPIVWQINSAKEFAHPCVRLDVAPCVAATVFAVGVAAAAAAASSSAPAASRCVYCSQLQNVAKHLNMPLFGFPAQMSLSWPKLAASCCLVPR